MLLAKAARAAGSSWKTTYAWMVPLDSLMLPVMMAAFLDIFASSLTGTDLFLMLSILPYLHTMTNLCERGRTWILNRPWMHLETVDTVLPRAHRACMQLSANADAYWLNSFCSIFFLMSEGKLPTKMVLLSFAASSSGLSLCKEKRAHQTGQHSGCMDA